MASGIAASGRNHEDLEFFTDTQKLLGLLVRLNREARPIFDDRHQQAVDMARIRWEDPGGIVLGELADLVLRRARQANRRWNPMTKRWEQAR